MRRERGREGEKEEAGWEKGTEGKRERERERKREREKEKEKEKEREEGRGIIDKETCTNMYMYTHAIIEIKK